ncbi:hypothetical protein KI387_026643, partial [Taxus chinensis]
VADNGGGSVATGICETLWADEVTFWMVAEGMVDVAGVTYIADMAVIAGIGPSCETTGDKVDAGSVELDGANAGVGVRVGGIDMGMLYIN